MPKPKGNATRKTAKPIKVSPLNDIVVAAMFTDVKSAGLAAEHLVKDVLGEYGKRLGKVISVRTQDYHKLANFRGTRVDVVCRTADNELWLIEFQMYNDEFMFERNMVECSYRRRLLRWHQGSHVSQLRIRALSNIRFNCTAP
jgi:hypothetical protein